MSVNYEKGSFTIIPNTKILSGQKTEIQTLFLWLCVHSDKNGQCYPSRAKLAKEAGISVKTVDRVITSLCELGLISKQTRKDPKKQVNLTNVYQILVVGGSVPVTLGVAPVETLGVAPVETLGVAPGTTYKLNTLLTKSINLLEAPASTPLPSPQEPSIKADGVVTQTPQSQSQPKASWTAQESDEAVKKLRLDKKPHIKLIALFFYRKKFRFANQEQLNLALKKNLKFASELVKAQYTQDQISWTMNYFEDEMPGVDWSMSAIQKRLPYLISVNFKPPQQKFRTAVKEY